MTCTREMKCMASQSLRCPQYWQNKACSTTGKEFVNSHFFPLFLLSFFTVQQFASSPHSHVHPLPYGLTAGPKSNLGGLGSPRFDSGVCGGGLPVPALAGGGVCGLFCISCRRSSSPPVRCSAVLFAWGVGWLCG